MNNRHLYIFSGILMVLGYLFFSYNFYIERLYGDAAWYIFKLINTEQYTIEHGRRISVFIQLIPLYLVNNNYSLNQILLWFSLNEWIYCFVSFLVLVFLFKDIPNALGFLFALLIGSRFNYFNQVSELILATPLVFMYASLLNNEKTGIFKIVLISLLVLTILNSHPLYMMILPVITIISFLYKAKRPDWYFVAICIIMLAGVVYSYFKLDPYEQEFTGISLKDKGETLADFKLWEFLTYVFPLFAGWLTVLVLSVMESLKDKKKLISFFLISFVIAYSLLILVKFGNSYDNRFEPFERYYFPIPLILGVYFFNHVIKKCNIYKLILILILVPLFQFSQLYAYGEKVKLRTRHIFNAIEYSNSFLESKFAFRKENFTSFPFGHDWTLSAESILFSSLTSNKNTKQLFIHDAYPPGFFESLPPDSFIYAPSSTWIQNVKDLNPKYFIMNSSKVRIVSNDENQSDYPNSYFEKFDFELPEIETVGLRKKIPTDIIIKNHNDKPLFSGRYKDGILFSYTWFNVAENKFLERQSDIKSPFLADIYSSIHQFINVETPKKRGKYIFQPYVVFDNGRKVNLGKAKTYDFK